MNAKKGSGSLGTAGTTHSFYRKGHPIQPPWFSQDVGEASFMAAGNELAQSLEFCIFSNS